MIPPLRISNVPTTGPTGRRDNLDRLHAWASALVPVGQVVQLLVAHDDACPCAGRARSAATACTCDRVDVQLRMLDVRAS